MGYIRWFREIDAKELDLVGGKGANLGEMTKVGLPVPPGFCLIAQAYRDFIDREDLKRAIFEILDKLNFNNHADVEARSASIRKLIMRQPVPDDMIEELLEGYRRLCIQFNSRALPVAVRSSATAEDLPEASFAGQQDTYLNIQGDDQLVEHVKKCWASLWTSRAMIYRDKQGFDHLCVYLAVVVQAMIEADFAGILFTANPLTGERDETVINASWGLGEAIVSGLVTPDTIIASNKDGRILSHEVGTKEQTIEYAKTGGTNIYETPSNRRETPVLSEHQVKELVGVGVEIAKHFGSPQDIEWAYQKGRYYLLQSRPITTIPAISATQTEYNRTMFLEIFPDPLSPIFLSVMKRMLKEMLDYTFHTFGLKTPNDINAIGDFYNQPYFNRSYIAVTLAPLPASIQESLITQIVNPFEKHAHKAFLNFSPIYLRMIARMILFLIRFPKKLPHILERYHNQVDRVVDLSLDTLTDVEITNLIRHLVFDYASPLMSYDFLMIAVIGRTYRMMIGLLERYLGADTEEMCAKLISGVTGNVTMETNKCLWDLAEVAKAKPEVVDILRNYREPEVGIRMERIPEGRAFLDAMDKFLSEFGHREIRLDIMYPTWSENPAPVFGFVRAYLDADETQSPHLQQDRLVKERHRVTKEVLKKVQGDRIGRYMFAPIFRWLLKQTLIHARERDTMHFEMTRLFPPVRRMILELGNRWVDKGLLTKREDLFYLSFEELEAMAERPRSFKSEVQIRRAEYEQSKSRPWPNIIRDGEEIYSESLPIVSVQGEGLKGIAGSPGIVTGVVRLIRGPEDFGKLQRGDILVAPLTNPAWTPLFAVASGVVTEVGGILSHGAIVAREYGIPAVMSVAGATKLLTEGQEVTVDGTSGMVY